MSSAVVLMSPAIFLIEAIMPNDYPPISFLFPTVMACDPLFILCILSTSLYRRHANLLSGVFSSLGPIVVAFAWKCVRFCRNDREMDVVLTAVIITNLIAIRNKFPVSIFTAFIFSLLHFVASLSYVSLRDAIMLVTPIVTFIILCLATAHWIEWLDRRTFYLQRHLDQVRKHMASTKARSQRVLTNILPAPIIEAYRNNVNVNRRYEDCTVIFIKLLSIPSVSRANMMPALQEMNRVISAIETCCDRHGVEKVKTVGALFMAVVGAPSELSDHATRAVNFGLDVLALAKSFQHELQIGMHSGSVIGGVIGAKIFWDIWGDSVNLASRMCTLSRPGYIQCTEAVQQRLHASKSVCFVPRDDLVAVKGKGLMNTFYVHRTSEHHRCKNESFPTVFPLESSSGFVASLPGAVPGRSSFDHSASFQCPSSTPKSGLVETSTTTTTTTTTTTATISPRPFPVSRSSTFPSSRGHQCHHGSSIQSFHSERNSLAFSLNVSPRFPLPPYARASPIPKASPFLSNPHHVNPLVEFHGWDGGSEVRGRCIAVVRV